MIIAVFFDPDTGTILQCTAAPQSWVEADGRAWIAVPEFRATWDATHRVVDGALVAIAP
tara:strand:- start:3799 stop:3975 length:177 start_codon:yes stop_codon:yes gene_type:complete